MQAGARGDPNPHLHQHPHPHLNPNQALEATGGDVAAAKASIEAEMASTWAAEDEAKQVSIKEGSTVLMEMRDAKAKKKFEEAEAKAAE